MKVEVKAKQQEVSVSQSVGWESVCVESVSGIGECVSVSVDE